MSTALVLYMPVVHKTYLELLESEEYDALFLMTTDFAIELVPALRKDLRAVEAHKILTMLVWYLKNGKPKFQVVAETAQAVARDFSHFVLPDEDISHIFAERFLDDRDVEYRNVFLRYDSKRTTAEFEPDTDEVITSDEFAQSMIARCDILAQKSADWWHQIGGLVVKDGQVIEELCCFNHAEPVEMNHHHMGDPRGNFKKGLNAELTIFSHTEQSIVSKAARLGIALEGADLFVTTFPCPWCAKAVANAGFKTVFYRDGYAMLDGEEILKVNNIRIVRVVERS